MAMLEIKHKVDRGPVHAEKLIARGVGRCKYSVLYSSTAVRGKPLLVKVNRKSVFSDKHYFSYVVAIHISGHI